MKKKRNVKTHRKIAARKGKELTPAQLKKIAAGGKHMVALTAGPHKKAAGIWET